MAKIWFEIYIVSVLYMQARKCSVHARMYTMAKRKSPVEDEWTGNKWEFGSKGRVNQWKIWSLYQKCSIHASS